MRFVACTYEGHASEILAIFNDAIVNSTALYDYKPRAPESMVGWFKAKQTGRCPVIGAIDQQDRLLGFASYGSFRAWPAYKYSIEHSDYVERTQRRRGVGEALMRRLLSDNDQDFLKVALDNPDLRLFSVGAIGSLTDEQRERQFIIFNMLISLFERAYLVLYEEGMTPQQSRRWHSSED